MKKEEYDLIVIGAGTAGLTAALYSSSKNFKTALIDSNELGGVCLNTGCIPTKAMLYASYLYHLSKELKQFGINLSNIKMDFNRVMKRVKNIILETRKALEFSIKNKNLTYIKEKSSFVSENEIKFGKKIINGKKIIICTGAKPKVPPIKGLDKVKYLLSDNILELSSLPNSLIIVGGGYISLEFSTFFNDLGTKVYVLEVLDRIISNADKDISLALKEYYLQNGVDIKTSITISEVLNSKRAVKVHYKSNEKNYSIEAEKLLVATGRVPNTFSLNLEAAGIEKEKNGAIKVNDFLQTTNPNIYAVGDVNGKSLLAHSAKREALIAVKNALENSKEKMDYSKIPWAVFTYPPIGGIGLTEEDSKIKKINYGVLKADFRKLGKSKILGDRRGLIKVIYNKDDKKIIGCFIIGNKADELIHEFAALMTADADLNILKKIIHIHPTLAEVVDELKEENDVK